MTEPARPRALVRMRALTNAEHAAVYRKLAELLPSLPGLPGFADALPGDPAGLEAVRRLIDRQAEKFAQRGDYFDPPSGREGGQA